MAILGLDSFGSIGSIMASTYQGVTYIALIGAMLIALLFLIFVLKAIPAEVFIQTGNGIRIKKAFVQRPSGKRQFYRFLFSKGATGMLPNPKESEFFYKGKTPILKIFKNTEGNYTYLTFEKDVIVTDAEGNIIRDEQTGKALLKPILQPYDRDVGIEVIRVAEETSKRWHYLTTLERWNSAIMLTIFTVGAVMLIILKTVG